MSKIIIVNQKDAKDCGACALQSVIRYYGGYVSLEKIREDTFTSIKGTSVYHLMEAAKKYGFDVTAKKYLDKTISGVNFPIIAHVKYPNGLLHFVVVYGYNKKVLIMDPAKGKVLMSKEQFAKIFTGVIIEFSVNKSIMLLEKESNIYLLFLKILANNKKLSFSILLCTILVTFFTIISGLYFKVGYEMIIMGNDLNKLKYIIFLFSLILGLKLLLQYKKSYYENHLNKNIDVGTLGSFIRHIFNLPLKVIASRSTGEIVTRVNEITSIKNLFSDIFLSCLLDLILSLGTIICLFYINRSLAFILCFVILLYIGSCFITNKYVYKRIKENIDLQTQFNAKLIECIDMIDSIKNLNKTSTVLEILENTISSWIYDSFTFSKFMMILNLIKESISEIGLFIINSYGFYQIYQENLSLISLVTFNTLLVYFINPIKNLVEILPKYNFLRASFSKICDFIDIEEEKIGKKGPFVNDDIRICNVSFSYDSVNNILNNLSLKIKKGEKIMLKGHSGSGKSTLCNLLQRKYFPSKGEIFIGKYNLKDYSLKTIHENICYIGQKENIYTDTIKNNILFYQKENSNFQKVCEICHIEDIVCKKNFRYDTGIDNNANNISGGEKQRIILARALLNNFQILILDEALSETDNTLEKNIIENIIKAYPDKTLIYISHKNHEELFERVINLKEAKNEN